MIAPAARKGFTLIELLIALTIVGLLAAILLPVFALVRERGRRTTCQSNLRQLALAMRMYVADNDSQYPLDLYMTKERGVRSAFFWEEAIFPYVKNARVFFCADCPDEPEGHLRLTPSGPVTIVDYDYDVSRLNLFHPPYPTKNVTGTRDSSQATPATIWLNGDILGSSIDPPGLYSREVHTSCGLDEFGGVMHSGGADYSFLDGHVQWLTPEGFGAMECLNGPRPAPFKF